MKPGKEYEPTAEELAAQMQVVQDIYLIIVEESPATDGEPTYPITLRQLRELGGRMAVTAADMAARSIVASLMGGMEDGPDNPTPTAH